MAFGQASGPPASHRQIETLEGLLVLADFGSFREARHRLGLSQRQANGKFTSAEASELIERLTDEFGDGSDGSDLSDLSDGSAPSGGPDGAAPSSGRAASPRSGSAAALDAVKSSAAAARAEQRLARERDELLAGMPADAIADELTRRGWLCMPPVNSAALCD